MNSLSPHLNPIENLWSILFRAVYANETQYNNINDLKIAIKKGWANIPIEILRTLAKAMKSRVFEVIKAHRGWTKY